MNCKLAGLIATFIYAGKFPVAPGTLASALALVLVCALARWPLVYVAAFVAVTVLGFFASAVEEKTSGKKDPGHIVIDEVAGIFVSFAFVPLSWPVVIAGFFLFRAFDMFKIAPADHCEKMGGGFGIMADDLVAGLYTNLVLQAALFLSIRI
jgi:phosphatidylglycerophosphatase A